LTFPREEDISIFISIVIDVDTSTLAKFCVSSFAPTDPFAPPIVGSAQEFIPLLSDLLRRIQMECPAGRTQIYTYSPSERGAIISHLINVAVSDTSSSGDIRLCLGTLCDGASLLLTDYQPLILSGVLLSLLSKKNSLKLQHLRACCQRLNLDDTGTVEMLRGRIEAEQKRLAGAADFANSVPRRREVGQLRKIVVLKQEIHRLVALPIPGYTDLPQIAQVLLFGANIRCASDDELFAAWSSHDEAKLKVGLEARNRCMRALVRNIRDRIARSGPIEKILLNEAKLLEKNGMMDLCRSKPLRKLSFMLQVSLQLRPGLVIDARSSKYLHDYKNYGMIDWRAVPMLHCFVITAVRNRQMENGNIFLPLFREVWSHVWMTVPIMIGSWSQKTVKPPKMTRMSRLRYSLTTYCVRRPHRRVSCKFSPHRHSVLACLSTESMDKGQMGTAASTYQGEVLRR